MVFAPVVPAKGVQSYVIKIVASDTASLGHPEMVLTSDGEPAIVGRYDGLKIEGVMSLGNNQLLLGSDDEALGCLVAAATLINGGTAIEPNVKFINLGMRASAQNESVELKRWGLSGMAPFCF